MKLSQTNSNSFISYDTSVFNQSSCKTVSKNKDFDLVEKFRNNEIVVNDISTLDPEAYEENRAWQRFMELFSTVGSYFKNDANSNGNFIEGLANKYKELREQINCEYDNIDDKNKALERLDQSYESNAKHAASFFSFMARGGWNQPLKYIRGGPPGKANVSNEKKHLSKNMSESLEEDIYSMMLSARDYASGKKRGLLDEIRTANFNLTINDIVSMYKEFSCFT